MSPETLQLHSLQQWLKEVGFPEVQFETMEQLLILKLPDQQMDRLLGDAQLRIRLVEQAKAVGFTRTALELKR